MTEINTTDAEVNVSGDGDVTVEAKNNASVAVSGSGETVVETPNATINSPKATVNIAEGGSVTAGIPIYSVEDLPTDGAVRVALVTPNEDSDFWHGHFPITSTGNTPMSKFRYCMCVFDENLVVHDEDQGGYVESAQVELAIGPVEHLTLPAGWFLLTGPSVALSPMAFGSI